MRILTRYVLIELIKVFLVTLTSLTLLMILVGVSREAVREGLGFGPVLRLIPYFLPDALRFAVPGTILFAVCSVYGRMSADNEVISIKSLGISPMVIIWPALALAVVVSLVAVWLNDMAVSWGRQGMQRVVVQSVEEIAYRMLRSRKSYSGQRFSITVKDVIGRRLIGPRLSFKAQGDFPVVTITAREAELQSNPEENTLSIFVTDSTVDTGGVSAVVPGTIEQRVPLSDAARKGDRSSSPSQRPLRRIPQDIVKHRKSIDLIEQSMAARAGYQLLTGDFDGLTSDEWQPRAITLANARNHLYRLRTEPHRRWANGFSCLCFVMIGAPFAIRRKNADFLTSFFTCFLPILIVYYPVLAIAVDRAKFGAWPPYSVWLGNGILFLCGLALVDWVRRH